MAAGLIVSTQFSGVWTTSFFDSEGHHELRHALFQARVVKRRDACTMVLAGVEWDEGFLRQWPQSWLCTRTVEAAHAVIGHMSPWLRERYLQGGGQLGRP